MREAVGTYFVLRNYWRCVMRGDRYCVLQTSKRGSSSGRIGVFRRAETGLRQSGGGGDGFAAGAGGGQMFGDGFGAGADVEFFVDVPDMGVDGGVGNLHLISDFLVEKALGEE